MFENMLTEDVHVLLKPYIKPGMTVCDLTMGNGYDTLYLAELVGPEGQVYGFDIQKQAIDKTRELLDKTQISQITLIHDNHCLLGNYVDKPIHIAMMNLGYLPGGDKSITTNSKTTIEALDTLFHLLSQGGVVSVIVYKGHDHSEEFNAVNEYFSDLPSKVFQVRQLSYVNRKNNVPVIYFVRKK